VNWFARVAFAYVFFVIAGITLIQQLARADRYFVFSVPSGDRLYRLVGYRDVRLPFGLTGFGRSPGELEVHDRADRVLDSRHLDDVMTVRDVAWGRFHVDFSYDRGGETYRTEMDLGQ